MEEERALRGIFDLGVRDFLLKHLVDHRECGVQKEYRVDEAFFLFEEFTRTRCLGLRQLIIAFLLKRIDESDFVFYVLQIRQGF